MKINSALAVQTPNRTMRCFDSAHWEKIIFIPADLEDAGFFLFNIWRVYFSVHTPFAKHLSTSRGSSALISSLIVIPCSHLTPIWRYSPWFSLWGLFWLCHKQSASSKPSRFPVPWLCWHPKFSHCTPETTCKHFFLAYICTSCNRVLSTVKFLILPQLHLLGLQACNTRLPYSLFKQNTANKNAITQWHYLDTALAFHYLSAHYCVKLKASVMALNGPGRSTLSPCSSGLCWENWKPQMDTSLQHLPHEHHSLVSTVKLIHKSHKHFWKFIPTCNRVTFLSDAFS